jgi:hypothetical protein
MDNASDIDMMFALCADSGLLSLDVHVVGMITDELGFLDYIALRATCSHFRSILLMPEKQKHYECMKRGLLYDCERRVEYARDAGARDLMSYSCDYFAMSREIWCEQKWIGCESAIKKYKVRQEFRKVLDADIWTIARACERDENVYAAFYVGQTEVPRVIVRIVDKLLGIQDIEHNVKLMTVIGNIITGVATSRYASLACELLRKYRLVTDKPQFSVAMIPKIIRAGNLRMCSSMISISAENAHKMIFHAARSGSRRMCKYIALHSEGAPIRIVDVFDGAIRANSIKVYELAREWLRNRACCMVSRLGLLTITATIREYPYIFARGESRDVRAEWELAWHTLGLACVRGSRAIASVAREWFKCVNAEYCAAADAKCMHLLCGKRDVARIVGEIRARRHIDYSSLFKLAASRGLYWMSDLIYQWSLDDNVECDIKCLGNDDDKEYRLARVAMCGRYLRAIRDKTP